MLGYTYTKMKYILYVQGVNYKWKICHPQFTPEMKSQEGKMVLPGKITS